MSPETGGTDADADGSDHQPNAVDDTAGRSTDATEPSDSAAADGFGRQGWVLVAGIVLCFLVLPGVIYLRPATPAAAGLPFFATFLVLPLVPAVILGLLAVWSMRAAA